MNMPLTIEVKLTKIGNSLRITVPKEVLKSLSWKAGDMLEVGLTDHSMIVKKATKQNV
jgi:putative addiction module antidote